MVPFNGRNSNRQKTRSNHHHRHMRTLALDELECRQMLAAIHDLDFAPVAEQQPSYAEQAEMAGAGELDCQAMDQAAEPSFRPNPAGDGTTEQLDRQGTNSDAWDRANDPRRVIDALSEDSWKVEEVADSRGWKVEELADSHGWKVEEILPDVIALLSEDSWKVEELAGLHGWKVEEVLSDVIDLLAEESWKVEELAGSEGWKVEEFASLTALKL